MCTCTLNQKPICRLLRRMVGMQHKTAAAFAEKVNDTLDLGELGYFFHAIQVGGKPGDALAEAQKDPADRLRLPARRRAWRVPV